MAISLQVIPTLQMEIITKCRYRKNTLKDICNLFSTYVESEQMLTDSILDLLERKLLVLNPIDKILSSSVVDISKQCINCKKYDYDYISSLIYMYYREARNEEIDFSKVASIMDGAN